MKGRAEVDNVVFSLLEDSIAPECKYTSPFGSRAYFDHPNRRINGKSLVNIINGRPFRKLRPLLGPSLNTGTPVAGPAYMEGSRLETPASDLKYLQNRRAQAFGDSTDLDSWI